MRQKVLQSVAAFRCYKLRQNFYILRQLIFSQSVAILLESEVVVTKWAKIVTKCGSCDKVGQKLVQSVAILLQSEVVVTKWGKNCYKVWQLLQSGAIVTK